MYTYIQGVQESIFLNIGAVGERSFEPDEVSSNNYVGQILVSNYLNNQGVG